jgi:hypothetical protein
MGSLRPDKKKIAEFLYVPHDLQARASQIVKLHHWLNENEKVVPFPDVIFDYRRLWVQNRRGKCLFMAFPITVHHRYHQRPQ